MSVPTKTTWPIKNHTRVKHEILKEYLKAWVPILGQTNPRIVYIDGFSGPGVYEEEEPGSPTISLQCGLMHADVISEMTFMFIEKREDRINKLESHIADFEIPPHFNISVVQGKFEGEIESVLNHLNDQGLKLAPTFAFVDPFGFKGLPINLLHRILEHRSTEVFTNIQVDSVNRWKDHTKEKIREHVQQLFGGEIPVPKDQNARMHDHLRDVYKDRLGEQAEFVRSFRMLDSTDRPLYDLFFASNNDRGHEEMKKAMWNVDPSGNFRFSDAVDGGQTVLFDEEPAPQLLDNMLDKYGNRGRIRAGEIERWVLDETAFLRKHKTKALEKGEEEGAFYVEDTKTTGEKRHSGFPAEVVIDFSRPGDAAYEQGDFFE